ncbi:unnamed protein product [Owenia fusiformis]|uniref:Uncharacterized protein n=1 Tax=Owenia fusiformis TaxID=6347 RepID=A0A8J1XSZ6_OWEFU|nr:unnamed protein product [Owenia fusiformis]
MVLYIVPDHVPTGFSSYRFKQALVLGLAFFFVFGLRMNMAIGMVCMVRLPPNMTTVARNVTNRIICEGERRPSTPGASVPGAMFEWSSVTQGWVLSCYYIGYILTQIVGGFFATKLGTKKIFAVAMSIAGLTTVLIPPLTRLGGPRMGSAAIIITLRTIQGLAMGVTFPANVAHWSKWSPVFERTKLVIISSQGSTVGALVASILTGILCAALGWDSIFYVFGILCILWLFLWMFHGYDSPRDHPRISEAEREFIEDSIGQYDPKELKPSDIPWKRMLTSQAVIALMIVHMTANWSTASVTTVGPTYLAEVLQFNPLQIGVLSGGLALTIVTSAVTCAVLADYIRRKGYMSTTAVRKTFYAIGVIIAATSAIIMGFLDCRHRSWAVFLLVLSALGNGPGYSAYNVNHLDIAPKYAGVLFGITNTFATIPAIVAPVVIRMITQNGTSQEWQAAYIMGAAIGIFGLIVFTIFGKGEVQDWAKDDDDLKAVELDIDLPEKVHIRNGYISDTKTKDNIFQTNTSVNTLCNEFYGSHYQNHGYSKDH